MFMPYFRLLMIGFLIGCQAKPITGNDSYQSETLEIHKITDQVYQHTSFLQTESFGRVPCNGMIIFHQNEAIIFDTPTDNNTSLELIDWVENHLHGKIKAIIPTHFHADCLAGLDGFHNHGVPSFAHSLTIELAEKNGSSLPQNGFEEVLELKVGDELVLVEFVGEGHTRDNVVGYYPGAKALFGGCLIKETGAGKGYLEDANVSAWPVTVAKLKSKYPDIKIVIPGHGKPGGVELLDYTTALFEPE